jgi:hypothetical protein
VIRAAVLAALAAMTLAAMAVAVWLFGRVNDIRIPAPRDYVRAIDDE